MKKSIALMTCAVVLLSACEDASNSSVNAPAFISEVPESIVSIAAPGQDLSALQIDPIDGCYTYRHIGPVETTMLPLRAKGGRPICTRAS